MTFYVCFGKDAGFRFEFNKRVKRIVLGKFSIAIVNNDIEILIDKLINKIDALKKSWQQMIYML